MSKCLFLYPVWNWNQIWGGVVMSTPLQIHLWASLMDGEGQDSVTESKRYVGVTRLQEWVVETLVQFDWLDWYKKRLAQETSWTSLRKPVSLPVLNSWWTSYHPVSDRASLFSIGLVTFVSPVWLVKTAQHPVGNLSWFNQWSSSSSSSSLSSKTPRVPPSSMVQVVQDWMDSLWTPEIRWFLGSVCPSGTTGKKPLTSHWSGPICYHLQFNRW